MIAERKGEWLEIGIPQDWEGLTVEDLLKVKWNAPKGLVHQLRMEKGVRLNGDALSWKQPLQAGERIWIHLFTEEDFDVKPEPIDFAIVYEDDHLLIANKPSGIDTHPSEKGKGGTLANGVAFHWNMNGVQTKVRHIHRLDRDTSGGIIFAKHALAGAIMDGLLRERLIGRTYFAFVQGRLKQKIGTIRQPIGRDRHHPTRRRVSERGDQAVTDYKVLGYDRAEDISLLEVNLRTGRTHQIRVHMSYLGHPLVSDSLYGGNPHQVIHRQALHAGRIQLPHPITGESLEFEIPWPSDMMRLRQLIILGEQK
ncbi:RluA family pseudouridine synthase [Ammoniphilus resinae]|uniref:Pseudouridine synthase n=1 Tax=Ammoniphilus resinae TaxID=861532 RepID=A0ABS4GWE2_9BACL|nr:RluA family pseudouridine synthase [Ammoniphilus resinae]MBP1934594.1 23S rRNA pseudouridine1911/1915/1917 synthase [Ammoniphilus resinae]